ASARVDVEPWGGGREDEDGWWRCRGVDEAVAASLRSPGKATLMEPGLLVWHEPDDGGRVFDRSSLATRSGGLLHLVGEKTAGNGLDALHAAAAEALLGRDLAQAAAEPAP